MNVVVERGGEASPEELAAIVTALTAMMAEEGQPRPSWQQAALQEALGGPPAQCAADVATPSPGAPAVLV